MKALLETFLGLMLLAALLIVQLFDLRALKKWEMRTWNLGQILEI